jgi:hypothetical protein
MKKIFAILALAVTAFAAQAADYASVDVETVRAGGTHEKSQAQYVRFGKEIAGIQTGVQSRTSRSNDGTTLYSSVEVTAGKNLSVAGLGVTPFVGAGHDNGKNGSGPYNYGLVGATAGLPVGPGYALTGVKTRVRSESTDPRQTVAFATYSLPVSKSLSLNLNASRSYQDIKETAWGLGVRVGF